MCSGFIQIAANRSLAKGGDAVVVLACATKSVDD